MTRQRKPTPPCQAGQQPPCSDPDPTTTSADTTAERKGADAVPPLAADMEPDSIAALTSFFALLDSINRRGGAGGTK
jgi:hypothetical protein